MTTYVLLTDDDNSTTLIACPSQAEAESVADAAVFNAGGVSAWLLPNGAITDWERVREILNEGGNCESILGAGLTVALREAASS